ncbi:hypothetical protein FRC00_006775, partial [Tulasnella sp. 408]
MSHITGKGAYATIEDSQLHWDNGAIVSDSDAYVFHYMMEEPRHLVQRQLLCQVQLAKRTLGINASVLASFMQAAVNDIHSIGATNLIVVSEMHQFLDSDGSGTSGVCVSSTIGAERIADATTWLKNNNLKGFLGEIGPGSN